MAETVLSPGRAIDTGYEIPGLKLSKKLRFI